MTDKVEWEFTVQLRNGVRDYKVPLDRPELAGEYGYQERRGIVWSLSRSSLYEDGRVFHQGLVVSGGVFDNEEDAKRDALEKLTILRCPIDRPLDQAIKWITDGV